jgi:hypothetical protein
MRVPHIEHVEDITLWTIGEGEHRRLPKKSGDGKKRRRPRQQHTQKRKTDENSMGGTLRCKCLMAHVSALRALSDVSIAINTWFPSIAAAIVDAVARFFCFVQCDRTYKRSEYNTITVTRKDRRII